MNLLKSKEERLQETLFKMKMAQKQMMREAKKREAESKKSRKQVENLMKEGQFEAAKVYAESAIRQTKEQQNYTQLAGRLDAVIQRAKTALNQQMMSKAMAKVVKGMSAAIKGLDMEKIATTMSSFENLSENVDVTSEYMSGVIGSVTQTTGAEISVEELMQETADRIGVEMSEGMYNVVPTGTTVKAPSEEVETRTAVKEL
mmetsp:Transcript_15800/g.17834  ORF Transcript_15800/g.17834 Transcript_15800/m.17834 type:complete len:202 (-) Transcript_15800:501-1106(-)